MRPVFMTASVICIVLGVLAFSLILWDGPEPEDPAAFDYGLPLVGISLGLLGLFVPDRTGVAACAVAGSFVALVSWAALVALYAG